MLFESKILTAIVILMIVYIVIATLFDDQDPPDISLWK